MVAYRMLGSDGSKAMSAQPVSLSTNSTRCQVLPPSRVRYTPRWGCASQRCPVAATKTVSPCLGSMAMRAMRSQLSSPMRCQLSPPSVVL